MKLPWSKKTATTVLVVDDAQDVLNMFGEILRFRGYEALCASSAEEGLKLVETRPPDLIILDIMMPKIDGMTALKILKSDPKTSAIPVIMLTALQQGKDVEKAFALGAAGYLIKPATPDRILKKIKEVLEP